MAVSPCGSLLNLVDDLMTGRFKGNGEETREKKHSPNKRAQRKPLSCSSISVLSKERHTADWSPMHEGFFAEKTRLHLTSDTKSSQPSSEETGRFLVSMEGLTFERRCACWLLLKALVIEPKAFVRETIKAKGKGC